ncbi:hypothetical protein [Lentzea jiangxiensis]|uniref:Uncharacterized protein n=1 Tax=Lentzea jiangxiensis TaxID=641025 RepID=A0A1H0X5E5_9PSEU|nr:hypothetical protein [Lentzea jiangxiensis]SDP98168.1 hypothetical protein SAMN05421507_13616 [Lentzea jiangxiensis]
MTVGKISKTMTMLTIIALTAMGFITAAEASKSPYASREAGQILTINTPERDSKPLATLVMIPKNNPLATLVTAPAEAPNGRGSVRSASEGLAKEMAVAATVPRRDGLSTSGFSSTSKPTASLVSVLPWLLGSLILIGVGLAASIGLRRKHG